ncbi:hypothetical protein DdX_11731 [Ditylenchus destructor]|uniref:Uncharacterized protein n=1 Tax=Ditylenchus destructor TaxID=166010 RepID=A0AAD4R0Z7_9BILA|nr:hypothetical protein DdX_11731 [Ditylenchus destructor]
MLVWVCLILAACCVTEVKSGKVIGGGVNSQGNATATTALEAKSTTAPEAKSATAQDAKSTTNKAPEAITTDVNAKPPKKTIKDVRAMMLTETRSILMCCAEYIPKGVNSGMCSFNTLGLFDLSKRKEFHDKMNLGNPEKLDVVYKSVLERLQTNNKDLNWNDEQNMDIAKALTKVVLEVVKDDMEEQFWKPDKIATAMKKSIDSLGTQPKRLAEGQYWGYIPASCFPNEYQPFHPRNEEKERNEDKTYFESLKKALNNATQSIWNMWPWGTTQ